MNEAMQGRHVHSGTVGYILRIAADAQQQLRIAQATSPPRSGQRKKTEEHGADGKAAQKTPFSPEQQDADEGKDKLKFEQAQTQAYAGDK